MFKSIRIVCISLSDPRVVYIPPLVKPRGLLPHLRACCPEGTRTGDGWRTHEDETQSHQTWVDTDAQGSYGKINY